MVLSPVAPQYSNLAGVTFDPFSPGSTIVGDVTLGDVIL
jgi:hypothetical protein